MAKILFYSQLLFVALYITSCNSHSSSFKPLDLPSIDSVIMTVRGSDYIDSVTKKLSRSQTDLFVNEINSAAGDGLWKFLYRYKFEVYTGNKTRFILASGPHFKFKQELGDWTFRIRDSTLFGRLNSQ